MAIAGDHGEGLGDHGELTHGMLAYDSTLRVPLVLAVPGVRRRLTIEPVSLVELAGTLVQLAGVLSRRDASRGTLLAGSIDRTRRMRKRNIRGAPAGTRSVCSPTSGGN